MSQVGRRDQRHMAATAKPPRPPVIDLHLHTSRGSSDSNLAPHELIEQARGANLHAICVTEHDYMWDLAEMRDAAAAAGIVLLRGMEVTTEAGHVGVIGLDGYVGGIFKLRELRRIAAEAGALLIANHPFRYRLDPKLAFFHRDREIYELSDIARACRREIFSVVDAIEVANGACSEEENRMALEVARALGLAEVGGSDSHSRDSVGCAVTLLESEVSDERSLVDAIKARRCRAETAGSISRRAN